MTVEDTYELHLDRDVDAHPNCVAMQARQANVEGRGRIPAGELFEAALRMAPGVLIVGEVRRPEVTGVRDGSVTRSELMRVGPEGREWVNPLSDRRREVLAGCGYDDSVWFARSQKLYA